MTSANSRVSEEERRTFGEMFRGWMHWRMFQFPHAGDRDDLDELIERVKQWNRDRRA